MNSARSLQNWFKNHITEENRPYTLDKNQAEIILDRHKNTLVTARAGSGKTRTIVAKIVYLLTHEKYRPEELIAFAFNRKARAEINERLTKITYDGVALFTEPPAIAATFHAFAYYIVKNAGGEIPKGDGPGDIDFYALLLKAAPLIAEQQTPYRQIMLDEYQDFSGPFMRLITGLRQSCPEAKLLAVGDDWQAINRFAGSDLKYFRDFSRYFPEDATHLYILNNYRSGKAIVKMANYFMGEALGDYQGGRSRCPKKAKIYLRDISKAGARRQAGIPLLLSNYLETVLQIIAQNPEGEIKILSRNNELSFHDYSLVDFVETVKKLRPEAAERISYSTIHRAKGLEAETVVLLEIDAKKFPNLSTVTGESPEEVALGRRQLFEDEARLFYVALTRAKERLYILTKTPRVTKKNRRENFLAYLNDEWIEEF